MDEKSSNKYDSQDRELIVSLLNEYTDKLRDKCDQLLKLQQQLLLNSNSFLMFFCLVLIICLTYYFNNYIKPPLEYYFFIRSFGFLIISLIVFLFINLYFFWVIRTRRINALKYDVRIMATRLEKIIRTTSQTEEYLESNFVRRIELDLRLADAEAAIEYYKAVVKDSYKKNGSSRSMG